MKTRILPLLVIAASSVALFTTSCKKEDTAKTNSSIVGKWNVLNQTFTLFDSMGNVEDGDTNSYFPGELVLDFRENGMVINTENDGSDISHDTSYYNLTGMTLKVSDLPDMSDPTTLTVQNLTTTDLNLSVEFDEDGYTVKNSISAKRQ